MKKDIWQKCWENAVDPPGFHRSDIHPFVKRYAIPQFLAGKRVFVPLCGKTNDLLWLRQYADHVTGIEIIEKPVIQFFSENNIPVSRKAHGFYADKLTVINGDIFDLTREQTGPIDFVYDRAALVAFPYAMRMRYLKKMDALTDSGSQTLLITFEHDRVPSNPPFSISPADVERYYGHNHTIELLESIDLSQDKMRQKPDQRFFIEHAFMLTKTGFA